MYVVDVEDEDRDDEQKEEEERKHGATGPKLQCTNKPLITQSTSFETDSRNSKIGFTESMPKASQARKGSSSAFVDGRLTSSVTSDTIGSKKVSHNKARLSFKHSYKTSSESEGICNDVRETTEEKEILDSAETNLNSGKPVISSQSTSGDYSAAKFSSGDLLIAANGKISRHVTEKDAEDPVSHKTLPSRKSQTSGPHDQSTLQHIEKEKIDSTSRDLRSSIRDSDRHSLASVTLFNRNSSTERRRQTPEPLDQSEIEPKTETIEFEDWTYDAGQVEFSRTSKNLDGKESIAGPFRGNLQSKIISNKTDGILRNSYEFDVASSGSFRLNDNVEKLTVSDYVSGHPADQRSSSRRIVGDRSTTGEKHDFDTSRRGSINLHSTLSKICDCTGGHTEERLSVAGDYEVCRLDDTCSCKCSSTGLLHAADSKPHENDCFDGSRKKMCNGGFDPTAERNFLLNAVLRRKGCEYERRNRNSCDVQSHLSEHNGRRSLLDSKTCSSAPSENRRCYSLNKSCACHKKHLPCPCLVGLSHPQTSPDCPKTSRSTKKQTCKDLLLQMFKGSGVDGRQRGRLSKTSRRGQKNCRDFEALPITVDGSTITSSLLIDENDRPNLQVIGEIAGQLESRIVGYVFAGLELKSSYGILVRNIPKVIETFCLDRQTGRVNMPLQFRLVKRLAYVKTSVRPFGYDFDFHPQFSIDMVNKYGRLLLPGVQAKFSLSPIDLDVRQELSVFIQAACPPSEAGHVSILLDCLLLLASDDGKSLFI